MSRADTSRHDETPASVRPPVKELAALGPLPNEASATEADLARRQELLHALTAPVSDEEALILVRLFGPDDCFGLAWTLVHLIETAPGWLHLPLPELDNEWVTRLDHRRRGRA